MQIERHVQRCAQNKSTSPPAAVRGTSGLRPRPPPGPPAASPPAPGSKKPIALKPGAATCTARCSLSTAPALWSLSASAWEESGRSRESNSCSTGSARARYASRRQLRWKPSAGKWKPSAAKARPWRSSEVMLDRQRRICWKGTLSASCSQLYLLVKIEHTLPRQIIVLYLKPLTTAENSLLGAASARPRHRRSRRSGAHSPVGAQRAERCQRPRPCPAGWLRRAKSRPSSPPPQAFSAHLASIHVASFHVHEHCSRL